MRKFSWKKYLESRPDLRKNWNNPFLAFIHYYSFRFLDKINKNSFLEVFFYKFKNKKIDKLTAEGYLKNTSGRVFEGVSELRNYGHDNTGKILYKLNSLGYRGEEFNPNAKIYIYVAGDSHTYGTGITWEDTYGNQFKKKYSKKFKIKEEDVNLMNFSSGGGSNDYLVRTIITNCNYHKPDVLICKFSHKSNREFISKKTNYLFCPSLPSSNLSLLEHPLMNEFNLFVDTIKNIIFLQYYCKANNIKYVFSWIDYHSIPKYFKTIKNTHRFLIEEIDFKYFLDKTIRDIQIDYAVDYVDHKENAHAGPITNKIYAQLLFDKYMELYGKKSWIEKILFK